MAFQDRTAVAGAGAIGLGVSWLMLVASGSIALDTSAARISWIVVSTVLVATNGLLAYDAVRQLSSTLHLGERRHHLHH